MIQIIHRKVWRCIVDEGSSISIMSHSTFKELRFSHINPSSLILHEWDNASSPFVGTLHQLPITFEGKTIYVNVEVTQTNLEFNILLCHDWIGSMGVVTSILYGLIQFPHNRTI